MKKKFVGLLIVILLYGSLGFELNSNCDRNEKVIFISRDISVDGYDRDMLDTTGDSKKSLEDLFLILLSNPDAHYILRVHANSDVDNKLSIKRTELEAITICDFFIDRGIDKSMIRPEGMEFFDPIVSNPKTPIDFVINHRVELVLIIE
jgi:outer membrane protein OmpA-like peptidoglycan-associated protein